MMTIRRARHVLTIDLEEHFHAWRFDSPMRRRHWLSYQSRIEAIVERLLALLARHSARATFFSLGWLAERHPAVIRAISSAGHEVACLGYAHHMVAALPPNLFRDDIRRAKQILEDLIGQPVLGFRAPGFSITVDTPWALPVVAEAGFFYDSSLLGGGRRTEERIHRLDMAHHRSLWEIPPSRFNLMGFRLPVGGGYLRALSYPVVQALLAQMAERGEPIVLYLRAWELDAEQPRMKGTMLSEFRHYLNLAKMESRLHRLLTDFHFGSVRDALIPMRDGVPSLAIGQEAPLPDHALSATV